MAVAACLAAGPASAQGTSIADREWVLNVTPVDPATLEGVASVQLTRAFTPPGVDLSPMMPVPADQGTTGSCVAQSVAYTTRGYYWMIKNKIAPSDVASMPSAAFLHSQIAKIMGVPSPARDTCLGTGSDAGLALKYLEKFGLVSNADAPMPSICLPQLSEAFVSKNEFSIEGYREIFVKPKVKRDANEEDLERIKQQLAAGHPVMNGFAMMRASPNPESKTNTLSSLKAGEIYQGSLGKHFGEKSTGHAMVFVGYDNERQAFLLQNSWSTEWADKGFGWVSYDAVKADMDYAFVMNPGIVVPRPPVASWLRREKNIAEADQCALVYQDSTSASEKYLGFVETADELDALKTKHGAAAVAEVAIRPWPVCETLLTLDASMQRLSRPAIAMDAGKDGFAFGEQLGFSVTTPDFPSFLYLIYLQADGKVVNLVPRGGPIRQQLAPGTVLKFGDGEDGRQTFRASAPAGPEVLIAIAARSPLGALERLETAHGGQYRLHAAIRDDGEEEDDDVDLISDTGADDRLFLSQLRQAIAEKPEADQAGRDIAAEVLHLTISEK